MTPTIAKSSQDTPAPQAFDPYIDGFVRAALMMKCAECGAPTKALILGRCLACDEALHEEVQHV
jgi:hypothetical protein